MERWFPMRKKLRVAMLISGGGTTMQEVISATQDGRLPFVDPVLVIASKYNAGGIMKARASGVLFDDRIIVINPKDEQYADPEAFGMAIIAACYSAGVDFIAQLGWLPHTPANVIRVHQGMNQHPGGLDPGRLDFGGPGMYGQRVHCTVLDYLRRVAEIRGLKRGTPEYDEHFWTEVTTHRLTEVLDGGQIMGRTRVQVLPGDDVSTLQQRALPEEHRLQIAMLKAISEGEMPSFVRAEPLIPDEYAHCLVEAKRTAIRLFPRG